MAKCKDCIHFPICEKHTDPNESYPEVGGCPAFKAKDAFVELVRCKDCKNRGEDVICPMCWEEIIEWDDDGYNEVDFVTHDYTTDNGFCHLGERREGE